MSTADELRAERDRLQAEGQQLRDRGREQLERIVGTLRDRETAAFLDSLHGRITTAEHRAIKSELQAAEKQLRDYGKPVAAPTKRRTARQAKRSTAADRETRIVALGRAYYYGTTDQRRQAAAELRKLASQG